MDKRKRFWAFVALRTLANFLIILGIVFAFLSFWPFVKEELSYRWDRLFGKENAIAEVTQGNKESNVEVVKQLPPIKATPVNKDFSIVIEKIKVNAPIIAGVDSTSYRDYIQALKKGVAHAEGTAVPGSVDKPNNNVFLFAHSTLNFWDVPKYNAVFFLLRKLEKGDRIVIFYKAKRYDYIVFDKRVVEANDVKYLTSPSKDPILTLQTCDPPGTQLRRLIVTAKLDQ